MSSKENIDKSLEERIVEIEANLIEQEHRPTRLIWNFLSRKRKWNDENDRRRLAASKAIIWRFFTSPTTIALGSGGIIAVLTVFLLWRQNDLLASQNKLVEKQTDQLNLQTKLMESARRSSQTFIMGEVLSDLDKELNDPRNSSKIISNPLISRIMVLSRAMKPYYYYEGESLIQSPLSPERAQLLIALGHMDIDSTSRAEINFGSNFTYSDLTNSYFLDADLRGVNLRGSNLNSSSFSRTKLYNVHFFRLQMKKARMWNNDFFRSFFQEVVADTSGFVKSKMEGANFSYSSFVGADFRFADLYLANFSNTDLRYVNLTNSDLRYTRFRKVDLRGANLAGSDFSYVQYLDSVKVDRYDWLDYIKDSLKLKGAERIYSTHRVDSVFYKKTDKHRRPLIVKGDIPYKSHEPILHLNNNGIQYKYDELKKTVHYRIRSENFNVSVFDFKLDYVTMLEYKEGEQVKYFLSKDSPKGTDTIPANFGLSIDFEGIEVEESNVLNFYVLLTGSYRRTSDRKLYRFNDLYRMNRSKLMLPTKRLIGEEERNVMSKIQELSN